MRIIVNTEIRKFECVEVHYPPVYKLMNDYKQF